jgi:dienelactone hydrolase
MARGLASSARRGHTASSAPVLTRAALPFEESAVTALSAALSGTRHPQWIDIPAGSTTVRSFVVFPDRNDTSAPVVIITAYPEATHVFLYRQELGRNMAATEDAWPKAMAFFKQHLTTAAASR